MCYNTGRIFRNHQNNNYQLTSQKANNILSTVAFFHSAPNDFFFTITMFFSYISHTF